MNIKPNLKSDVEAKAAFKEQLLSEGFERATVTRAPADITAVKNGQVFYFEIKYTARTESYFGAATLTEWEAAIENESQYFFVVASKRNGQWLFHRYSPDEFMKFSTIPPFKVFFSVDISEDRDIRNRGETKSIRLTRERLNRMTVLYKELRKLSNQI